MHAYEVCWRENGLMKFRGFKYRDQFDRFIARMMKKANVQLIESMDNTKGTVTKY